MADGLADVDRRDVVLRDPRRIRVTQVGDAHLGLVALQRLPPLAVALDSVRSSQPAGRRIGAIVLAHSPHNGEHRTRFGLLPHTLQWIRLFVVSEARIRNPHIPNPETVSLLSKL